MESNMIAWEFAPTYGSDDDGFSDAFIEAFMGDVDRSLAREIIQNSLDARLFPNEPVIVEFSRLLVPLSTIPQTDKLKNIFQQCIEYFPQDKKVKSFFTKAIDIVDSDYLSILKISDSNTVGLRGGDEDNNGEWYCLVKAQGASSKQSEKQGSFGIGKGAPFAASAFRTVFYSTVNDFGENVFQGKARLVSHKEGDIVKRGIGSFGLPNYKSVRTTEIVPEFFRREKRGTDIYVLAYRGGEKEWKVNLIKSVLENFWAAIYNKDLIVKIDTKTIDENSLENDLIKYFGVDDPTSPYNYYTSFTKPMKVFSENLPLLGDCKLYMILQEKLPKKIALMRKSRMIIKYKGFHSPKSYAGVFICDDKNGNNILRDLEPPQHNDWEPKRNEMGTKILKILDDWIRNCLREMTSIQDVDTATMPELERWFQLPEDYEYNGEIENYFNGEYNNSESDLETAKELNKKIISEYSTVNYRHNEPVINKTEKLVAGKNNKKIKTKVKTSKNGSNGVGNEIGKKPGLKEIECTKRSYLKRIHNGQGEYIIVLESTQDYLGNVTLSYSADDSVYPAIIFEAKDIDENMNYTVVGPNIMQVKLVKNIRKKILVNVKAKQKVSLIIE